MGGIIKGVLLFILLIILFLLALSLYINISAEREYFSPVYEEDFSSENNSLQFYPDMRFQELPISYKIDSSCDGEKSSRVKGAFSILAEESVLSFAEAKENKEEYIFVSCNSSHNQEADGRGMFIVGEGGPLNIIRTGIFHLILKSKVLFFSSSSSSECKKPNIEIHEILHALGFDHSNRKENIMYPISNCKQELSQDVLSEIEKLYNFPSLPDFEFEAINASKKGRYLNFNLRIKNQGLRDANSVFVGIFTEGEEIDLFDVGELIVGGVKILEVENLRLPSSKTTTLTFFADPKNKISEIYEDNNKVDLYLEV